MISIQGYVDHIIFNNPDNGYTVFTLSTPEGEVTAVGVLQFIDEGEHLRAEGDYVRHPSFGLQFKISSYEILELDDRESILRYLSSGAIKGIKAALAEKIVQKFGLDTFRIMEEEPDKLSIIKGISLKKAYSINAEFINKAGGRRAMMFLQQYGIGNNLSARLYTFYHERIYTVISENPYRMIEDVEGVGFKTADEIALKVGIERHSDFRLRAGILYTLELSVSDGNTYIPENILLPKAAALLSVEEEALTEQLKLLSVDRKIVRRQKEDEIRIYLTVFYQMELQCAKILKDLDIDLGIPEKEAESEIELIEKASDITLDGDQRLAVLGAISHGVFIMTGGPGTGKTTTVRVLLQYFESMGMDVMLCAPTGRAAKRLSDQSRREAKTIHRMLEVTVDTAKKEEEAERDSVRMRFGRDGSNPLETDVIIVDEMSMVDITLFYALLSAVRKGTRLILVGDYNQLPSVGPGSVLRDLIKSERFSMVALTKIFRQAEESDIVMNAHAVLKGVEPKLDNKSRDFFFLNRLNTDEIIEGIIYLVKKKLPPYVHATPMEIQVLTPMKKGALGVESLNEKLQEALNPPAENKHEIVFRSGVLREGDKIMQIRNNYQMEWEAMDGDSPLAVSGTGVYNGDLGRVKSIDKTLRSAVIVFDDGREAYYDAGFLGDLDLAYAVTIHKSQGSEYPAVVMPLLNGPPLLFNRNLLYTGITRAKSCVMIIGSRDTVKRMISNTDEQERYTSLCERLMEAISKES